MSTAVFLLGLGLVVAGAAMIFAPAGLIVGGLGLGALAVAYERGGGDQT